MPVEVFVFEGGDDRVLNCEPLSQDETDCGLGGVGLLRSAPKPGEGDLLAVAAVSGGKKGGKPMANWCFPVAALCSVEVLAEEALRVAVADAALVADVVVVAGVAAVVVVVAG
eukprot:CAMPEP_0206474472 /NCGR_PEP_ID=MMETSP0324_2-20121206/33503_1 /ASSEMBLY_ACC=CAM_ASM_000836 /TAXON_ID=2866 /ORGANISM="Crypthecodinium cohnii, Strain Seligo" /LENGTH=112 /DNA_ID=CAMNT_0053949643 /DNA_START=13 /DNA_END=348 /DNA_ORIENTATION=-